jgi:hypothetical protein
MVNHARPSAPIGRVLGLALACVAGLLGATGCASGPLLDRAVRARGGPLSGFTRIAEADVEAGFPGTWRWRMTYLAPDHLAWSIVTTAGVDHYLFDGAAVRAFLAGRELAADTARSAPLRTQTTFVAVTNLDAARATGRVTPLPPSETPPGVANAVAVTMPPDDTRYRLGFDDELRLVWATGPFETPQMGRGEITARYDDYRKVRGLWLPFRTTYELGSRRIAVERTLRVCPNDPTLTAASFVEPDRLPACGPEAR